MITLELARQAFDEWRARKININTPTPANLWDMVGQLLSTHKRSELCKVLGISGHQILSHCTASLIAEEQVRVPSKALSDFVEATPPPQNVGMAELTLKGQSKILHLCLPTTALCEVLSMLGPLL